MPKIKLPRSSPSIDMTPMVDLAFLLVTFFMFTTKFRPDEPVKVTIPFSVSTTKIPENVITVNIDSAGVYFLTWMARMFVQELQINGRKYKLVIRLLATDIQRFSVMGAFGVPVSQMKAIYRGK